MIISFKHKGLKDLFEKGSTRGIQPSHKAKLIRVLGALNVAKAPNELALPSFKLHPLTGQLQDHWSITINGNWRVIFRFTSTNVELVDYLDYH